MPSKKRKYNARFPAGRIKKIMQTDEEVGKVAQAVPIIISRTLELFVESLLSKAMQVTMSRNAKTLSPSHVKQCILAESRFDFLRDLVKNIPDVSAAEEKEMLSAESSPNSSRYSDMSAPRRVAREDSTSSSSSDVKVTTVTSNELKRTLSETDHPNKHPRTEENEAIDLTKKPDLSIDLTKKSDFSLDLTKKSDFSKKSEDKPVRTANFYQETLVTEELPVQTHSVIKINPTYTSPQPSTSFTSIPKPKPKLESPKVLEKNTIPALVPIKPLINIDFSKNVSNPEIHLLDSRASIVTVPTMDRVRCTIKKPRVKKTPTPKPMDLDHGNLQIDEDYDT